MTKDLNVADRLGWLTALNKKSTATFFAKLLQVKVKPADLDMPESVWGFLEALHEAKQFKLLPEIFELVNDESKSQNLGQVIRVVSTNPLSGEQIKSLEAKLGSRVLIENIVKPGLVGGIQIKVGQQLIDKSYKTNLIQLQETLNQMENI
ncbi:F0F1 ATP synthase subunit delta [Candidatus Berkelbacteria bacterium]|nr:F0F1 ATP synthase subunit delta [Candidatus Berkelbacteria bacterium]